ncbi:endonuclease [Gordonia phage OneUp]|uniref:HNH endonuclease n=1 Tax=Gordonia phage OneUp TaxID=1838074 RepID=A0A166Y9D4_9CAUD|nr:endonuclease [Gordonia phage OneUp]ANA86443.1 HNH endonuclease [Gordonia phage OneUp]
MSRATAAAIIPEELEREYLAGATMYALADKYGVTQPAIRYRLKKMGVPLRRGGRRSQFSQVDPLVDSIEAGASDGQILSMVRDICEVDDAGCWRWTAAKDADGYGVLSGRRLASCGRPNRVHRLTLECSDGVRIPSRIPVHHTCANRGCVNPAHLQAVSLRENNAEMVERNLYLDTISELLALTEGQHSDHPAVARAKYVLDRVNDRSVYYLMV